MPVDNASGLPSPNRGRPQGRPGVPWLEVLACLVLAAGAWLPASVSIDIGVRGGDERIAYGVRWSSCFYPRYVPPPRRSVTTVSRQIVIQQPTVVRRPVPRPSSRLFDGVVRERHDNGRTAVQGRYLRGRKFGHWVWFDAEGRREQEGTYRNGQRHGDWRRFYASGDRSEQGEYRNDLRDGLWTQWYPDGALAEQAHWRQGELAGPYMSYHRNGQIRELGRHREGRRHGDWTIYHANGNKQSRGSYHLGELDGTWRVYLPDGTLIETVDYDRGTEIARTVLAADPAPVDDGS